jgi:hypothetical protein
LLDERLNQESFYQHAADLSTLRTAIQARARSAAVQMALAHGNNLREAREDLQRVPEWSELTPEQQSQMMARLDELLMRASEDLSGLRQLVNQDFVIQARTRDLRMQIQKLGHERQLERLKPPSDTSIGPKRPKVFRTVSLPANVRTAAQLDGLIWELQALKDLALYNDIEVTITIQPED